MDELEECAPGVGDPAESAQMSDLTAERNFLLNKKETRPGALSQHKTSKAHKRPIRAWLAKPRAVCLTRLRKYATIRLYKRRREGST